MNITTVGIDLAKLVFEVHGVDSRGKVALRKQLKRAQVVAFFAQLAPCLIGMEACGGAHFWARKGPTVRTRDQASTGIFHQGQRPRVAHTGRMYGCNLFL